MIYNKNKREIVSSKEISNLDKFAIKFINILNKYENYVIISGYVSILLGRSRVTEDIDLFIKRTTKERFARLYEELKEEGFWCLNAESVEEIFNYLDEGLAVRFARQNNAIPNIELKFAKKKSDFEAFEDSLSLILGKDILIISSLERQVAFKRYYLRSDKDIEDAIHIEKLFKEHLDYTKINKLKEKIENE